ncbi:L,D-transpeptidase family protein [bacterium]|nr:L,D-transpeptidase family protein [bacterium]
MIIKVINNNTLILDDFEFKCCVGKYGITKNKQEGDKKTPKGDFKLGNLYFREDRHVKPDTKLKTIPIKKDMGWCDDVRSKKYNKLIKISKKINHEKLTRKDSNYDFLIPINYNTNKIKRGKGSAIFIHITKNYKKTLGCVAIKKKDMLILLKLVKKNSTIKIF